MMNATAPSALLWFAAGFGIWSICFALLYGAQATGCEWGWHQVAIGPLSLQRLVLGAIFIVHVAVLALLSVIAYLWWRRRHRENGAARFMCISAAVLTPAALVATVWTGLPAVFLRTCIT